MAFPLLNSLKKKKKILKIVRYFFASDIIHDNLSILIFLRLLIILWMHFAMESMQVGPKSLAWQLVSHLWSNMKRNMDPCSWVLFDHGKVSFCIIIILIL